MTSRLPFAGMTVVVTRASHQSESLSDRLKELGAAVELFPLLEIAPPSDWSPVDQTISQLEEYNWIIFASVNAVNFFLQRVSTIKGSSASLGPASLATIGPITKDALEKYLHHAQYHPAEYIAESFVAEFPEIENLQGKRILWPKASVGRRLIQEQLEKAGATVDAVEVYQSLLPKEAAVLAKEFEILIERATIDVITFASAQTAKNFVRMCTELKSSPALSSLLKSARFITIGPETSKALQAELPSVKIAIAKSYTAEGMVKALLDSNTHD